MPLYVPWLTETIKKRGVRYLLHHYLGQFFKEKLTLDQLSIDIYEGKGAIKGLALDVEGLNDELDFIPFTFLEGCLIGQISVEVPWSSLATEACRVELEDAKFICRLKTPADSSKAHCTESTLLTRSLMTSSMQMAEDIVTTEDDDDNESPNASMFKGQTGGSQAPMKKDSNQMFEGLEMFAQLIDSVLRRTKLTARNTLFRIQPHNSSSRQRDAREDIEEEDDEINSQSSHLFKSTRTSDCNKCSSGDDYPCDEHDPMAQSDSPQDTVEFFIKFFRCEEIMESDESNKNSQAEDINEDDLVKRPLSAMPETVTKLLTLEDVEMRIGGLPVSNLIGRHTIMIKFNGQKSEISIHSGSPLLAVIGHKQLKTFFNVFDHPKDAETESSLAAEKSQKVMSSEDYAKIENQLLESAPIRGAANHQADPNSFIESSGRRWVDGGINLNDTFTNLTSRRNDQDYHSPNSSTVDRKPPSEIEPSLENLEAFSCELKLPGIWLCILKDGTDLPPMIKPYADSINSFQSIHKYIDQHMKIPHIRLLALKVAFDLTSAGINAFLGDLDISEHLQDEMNPTLHLLHNDIADEPMSSARYKASVVNNKEISLELLTRTKVVFDPTIIDRLVYDYKLFNTSKAKPEIGGQCVQTKAQQSDLNLTVRGKQFKVELMCPIPDLTPEGLTKTTQLRPQSFLFDFTNIDLTWQSDKLNICCDELQAFVKTQPKQSDNEAIRFVESSGKNNSNRIVLILEPSPSNLDTEFPNEIEQALNESSMYDSIYVGQASESNIPTEAFQTKRKVVRAPAGPGQQQQQHVITGNKDAKVNECDNEKIIAPGDRKHLSSYLDQTVMSTKLSIGLHLPICEVEFEDKEQLDLIYNRFGNDFVFWQPKAFNTTTTVTTASKPSRKISGHRRLSVQSGNSSQGYPRYQQPLDDTSPSEEDSEEESEVSFHSLIVDGSGSDSYENEVTCKITVEELFVRFNHQNCAAAMKQEISADNLLLGVVIDINKKPGTILSLVADNLELCTDSDIVLEGNQFGDINSTFALTAEIKRPTKALKDIKLAIQLVNGLFDDFKTETFTRFWQSINVTDEPILGYVAPKIITELHIDILGTALSVAREGARPALLAIDELYLTSMVMEQTSQVMIRMLADEVSLYLKRNREGLEMMKNYICLIDSGLIDLDVKFSQDGKLEFNVINNVITVRACQDSLSALCKLFNIMVRGPASGSALPVSGEQAQGRTQVATEHERTPPPQSQPGAAAAAASSATGARLTPSPSVERNQQQSRAAGSYFDEAGGGDYSSPSKHEQLGGQVGNNDDKRRMALLRAKQTAEAAELPLGSGSGKRGMNLLEDAMNDFGDNYDSNTEISTDRLAGIVRKSEGLAGSGGEMSGSERSVSNGDIDEEDDDESSGPPTLQRTALNDEDGDDESGPSDDDNESHNQLRVRDPNACILDESNPLIGDLFSQPLLPSPDLTTTAAALAADFGANCGLADTASESQCLTDSQLTSGNSRPIDESGFFVIGDDDVGAGIIDKMQKEPAIRKLVEGPINIIENHFKMTKPRTIPEMLAASLERYVLEEMTLVVNLYGGRDFDDEEADEQQQQDTASEFTGGADSSAELLDVVSMEGSSIRSRTGSVNTTFTSRQASSGPTATGSGGRQHTSSDSSCGSLKRGKSGSISGGGGGSSRTSGSRRKHLSEGAGSQQPGGRLGQHLEQRVRFGEGAVNLWESLDLMSSPDFLGGGGGGIGVGGGNGGCGGGVGGTGGASNLVSGARRPNHQPAVSADSKILGGTWRQTDVCIQLTLNKVKLLYEVADSTVAAQQSDNTTTIGGHQTPPIAWRFLLFIHDIEIKDRIHASDINKMLYEYCTESMPKRSTQFLTIKNVATINPSDGCEECDLRVSLKPLRLNIDQDTFLFLIEFFTALSKSLARQQSMYAAASAAASSSSAATASTASGRASGSKESLQSNASATNTRLGSGGSGGSTGGAHRLRQPSCGSNSSTQDVDLSSRSDSTSIASSSDLTSQRQQQHQSSAQNVAGYHNATTTTQDSPNGSDLPTHCHTDSVSGSANQQPVYIKSFTFSPDVPIRLDYHAKHLDFEQGALAGILMGLAHLDHSELVLRRVQAKHGMRGLDRVLIFTLNSWMSDIKRNQLPSILGGVGPMHSVIQLFQGMRDLVWMPIDHYRKDRRLVRGLQRGASSFSSSTAMAAINLMNRFISIVQCTAQIAHDIVTPPAVQSSSDRRGAHRLRSLGQSASSALPASGQRRHAPGSARANGAHGSSGANGQQTLVGGLNQPRNFGEGLAIGYTILKEGFNDTARNVAVGMQADDVRSAVGELVRQIPSTLLNPIISATEGAQNVLVGIRNQIAPDARREDQEKWKRRVRGK